MHRKEQIENLLQRDFAPLFVEVIDESHMHSVPENAQSHFKVTLVSDNFIDKSLIARHRSVNQTLSELLAHGIHALALHTLTPDEWFAKGGAVPQSPPCLGGSKQT